jgi:1-deoxy-D-xylulose-5-phosphate synthase
MDDALVERRRSYARSDALPIHHEPESLLRKVNSPADLRRIPAEELGRLAVELREFILEVVSRKGGYLSSNLGVVDLTLALHYMFDTPRDKLLWDAGHQTYAHKAITGRRDRLSTVREADGLSGFCDRRESEFDVFGAGHASTSISAALGLATARDLRGEPFRVVTVIGDGAMNGGLAFEALNHAGQQKRDLVVVLNDNVRSISRNVGAISRYLTDLQTNPFLNRVRDEAFKILEKLPMGATVEEVTRRIEKSMKSVLVPGALFQAFGFQYFGPVDGHDLDALLETFRKVQRLRGPVLVHVVTRKGKGYEPAEGAPDTWHGVAAFDRGSGRREAEPARRPSYSEVMASTAVEMAERDPRVVAITAAMPATTGLAGFQRRFPDRFFDVGIAEAHGVCFAAGLAAQGMRPIAAIFSTYLQRAYDQIIHDVALQDLPVIFALDRGGLVGPDGATHNGVFDLTYLRSIPNLVVAAPRDGAELRDLLFTALAQDHPFAVRYPDEGCLRAPAAGEPRLLEVGSWEVLREGEEVALLAVGAMVGASLDAAGRLAEDGIDAAVVNCRFVKPLDGPLLCALARRYPRLVTVEENTVAGGFGGAVSEHLREAQVFLSELHHLGVPDRFQEHASRGEVLDRAGLSPARIAERVREIVPPRMNPIP